MGKICTTIEQSKNLVELGLDVNTADMCYKCLGEDPYDLIFRPYSDWKNEYKGLLIRGDVDVIPAWSFTSLWYLLPCNAQFFKTDDFIEPYYCVATFKHKEGMSSFRTKEYDNPLDAVYEIICWLLKNKKL